MLLRERGERNLYNIRKDVSAVAERTAGNTLTGVVQVFLRVKHPHNSYNIRKDVSAVAERTAGKHLVVARVRGA